MKPLQPGAIVVLSILSVVALLILNTFLPFGFSMNWGIFLVLIGVLIFAFAKIGKETGQGKTDIDNLLVPIIIIAVVIVIFIIIGKYFPGLMPGGSPMSVFVNEDIMSVIGG